MLIEKLLAPRELIEAIATVLFDYLQVPIVYIALEESLPLYVTSGFTGLCVDLGFQRTSVLPVSSTQICEGVPIMLSATFAEFASGNSVIEALGRDLGGGLELAAVEDIVAKLVLIPYGELAVECADPEKQETMRRKRYRCRPIGTHFDVQLTFLDRISPAKVLFGDVEADEDNIAATVLNSILRCEMVLRRVLISTLVVSGGLCMIPGVLERLTEEMAQLLDLEQYAALRPLKQHINIVETEFSRNLLVWTGGSVFGALPALDRFALTKEDFAHGGVPDRIGENYLFASRTSVQEIHSSKDKSLDRLKDSLLAS